MNYYIIENKILSFENEFDATLYNYQKLNSEQSAFYELHNCSLNEVLNLKLNEYHVATLDEIKQAKIQNISNLSFEKRALVLPEYKLINAGLGIYDETETANIKHIVTDYRNEFYRLKTLIENATTIEDIDKIEFNEL